jgi:hypothetical protein
MNRLTHSNVMFESQEEGEKKLNYTIGINKKIPQQKN